jgi:hypothetical protein
LQAERKRRQSVAESSLDHARIAAEKAFTFRIDQTSIGNVVRIEIRSLGGGGGGGSLGIGNGAGFSDGGMGGGNYVGDLSGAGGSGGGGDKSVGTTGVGYAQKR